ncbi:hypothetical protein RA276_28130, partial [Pseudomonas syringae pv. tagetis]|uniref:hypothetical protein n=1 Tax=Pseudomonas syringae group genomosp. 7 TaxID=251699 RepID=UPI00376F98F9
RRFHVTFGLCVVLLLWWGGVFVGLVVWLLVFGVVLWFVLLGCVWLGCWVWVGGFGGCVWG